MNYNEESIQIRKKNQGINFTFLLQNSFFLITGTVVAILMANLAYEPYTKIIHSEFSLFFKTYHFNFHFIVNDILMCFFFALAAKEICEALLPGGVLSSPKKAVTPLIATVGGVIGPACFYIIGLSILNAPELINGWAIPCATDIAFSYLVARIVFGNGHPAIPFLLLLAIADDAISLVILAVIYPQGQINLFVFVLCVVSAVLFNLIILRKVLKVNNFWPYLIIAGPLSWYGFLEGGIHTALALVPIIPTLPHKQIRNGFFERIKKLRVGKKYDALNSFENWWKNPVEIILMLFGFVNAGVVFEYVGITTWLVSGGLLIGKPVGIIIMSFLATKLFRLELPKNMTMKDLIVISFIAGIGFTVALFTATIAFPAGENLNGAKMGALFSFFAFILAFAFAKIFHIGKYNKALYQN
ncbi:MAG: Na+/H+ antiporter NhaA [Clostridiales bacterium]